nr:unnamed protein product [Spirometra erinaceieuropaei]
MPKKPFRLSTDTSKLPQRPTPTGASYCRGIGYTASQSSAMLSEDSDAGALSSVTNADPNLLMAVSNCARVAHLLESFRSSLSNKMRTWILAILVVLALVVCLEAKKEEESPNAVAAVDTKDIKVPKRRRHKKKRDSLRRGNGNGHKRERRGHKRKCQADGKCGTGQECRKGRCKNIRRRQECRKGQCKL